MKYGKRVRTGILIGLVVCFATPTFAQEARRRWERMCQIRQEKFDRILPEVMRENKIDMWITMMGRARNLLEKLARPPRFERGTYRFEV